jgi:hypothetical protein
MASNPTYPPELLEAMLSFASAALDRPAGNAVIVDAKDATGPEKAALAEFKALGILIAPMAPPTPTTWEVDVPKLRDWYANKNAVATVDQSDDGQAVNLDTDGPVPPRAFRFQGQDFSGLTPTAWRLVDALWRCKNRTASFKELSVPVFQNELLDLTAVKDHTKFANRFFRRHSIAYHVTTDARTKYVSVVDGLPKEPPKPKRKRKTRR